MNRKLSAIVAGVILVTIVLAAVLGCSGGGKTKLEGTVTFTTWGPPAEQEVNKQIHREFEKAHPGTKVEMVFIPGEEYYDKITTMLAAGTAPDVLYGHPKYFYPWYKKGLILNLDEQFKGVPEFADPDLFEVSMYKAFTVDGHHVATINGNDIWAIFYNTDAFDAVGVGYPTPEWTWDDFLAAAQKLTVDENGDGDPEQWGTTVTSWYNYVDAMLWSFDADLLDDWQKPTKCVINTPQGVQALQLMHDMIYEYKVAPTPAQAAGEAFGNWDTGRIAMDFNGAYCVDWRKSIEAFKWDIADVPLGPTGKRGAPVLYAGYAVNAKSKNAALAWELAKFYQSETAQKYLAESGLITVINKKVSTSDAALHFAGAPAHHEIRLTALAYGRHNDAYILGWDEVTTVVGAEVDLLLLDEQTAEQTAANIEAKVNAILAEEE